MKPFRYLISLPLIGLSASLCAQPIYSRVQLTIPEKGLAWLESQGVEFDHGELDKEQNIFITTLSHESLASLKKTGVRYSVLVDDEVAFFQKNAKKENFYMQADAIMLNGKLHYENPCGSHLTNITVPAGFIPGSYSGYYTFQEIQQRIDSLVNHYPGLVQKIILPTATLEGRPLIVVKISDNVTLDEAEPEAFYTGLHHAREGMSMMNLMFFMQYLVENYAADNRIKELVDSRELYFMPCVNPDGYRYNETSAPSGGGMWRKNRRVNGGGVYGVDLNRNYNVDWGVTGTNISTSHSPSNDAYVGPNEFSEAETQAIRAFSETRYFTIAIDHHAYGNYYVTPYGRPANHPFTTADVNFYKYASALMARYNGYFAGDGMATVGYYAVGNSRDWHITGDIGTGTKQKTYGYTVEVGSGNVGFGFWPNPENIIPIAKSMLFANLQMAYMAGPYFELQDMNTMAVNSTSASFTFSLRRIGLTNAPVTVSLLPLEHVQSVGASVTINSIANYFDSVQRSITYELPSGLPAGTRVRFVYQISSAGINLYDTVTKIYQPQSLFTDNMEWSSTANWTFSGTWGTSTTAAYQGTRSLSESPSGNYASAATTMATCNTSLNLADATAAYLSFWVRHRAENAYDKLQIQVSSGAGYLPVCGNNTVSEEVGTLGSQPALTGIREAWTREIIDLRDYLGNPVVNFRFRFMSNGSNAEDGFYIDNIEVVKATQQLLAVKFISITAVRVPEGARITWEVVADNDHDRFEIERSDDGEHFSTIGTVKGNAPYRFIDPAPGAVNFYRVRAVDIRGRSDYSRIVTLESIDAYTVNVFPNPVERMLHVRFNQTAKTRVLLTITDIAGRIQYRQPVNPDKGITDRQINVSQWPAQLYLVKIRNLQTGEESVFKMIKK
ncbi:T9SS type A sorting domain-containing protein [Pseudoflavitalea sp. X16]|uniref:M14 family zinc carboxypeptidase n=1 Tax=Paraflavitalea devenefica TaxID=2716334 RepID=UPI00141DA470|nr:M14 family zinc carboxypeptidase [Paraflavitalea devenefica]NII25004.1 T9SS type A sorting domain-containing protein [Paraflavitalea devenefica]